MMTMKKARVFTQVYMDPNKLIPYENNNKIHSQDQIDRLAAGINTFGFDQAITVDKDFVVIKGHGRRLAAIKLGVMVPVVVRDDLTKEQADASRISDNILSSTQYDTRAIQIDLTRLLKIEDYGFTAESMGLSSKEMDLMLGDIETPDLSALMTDTAATIAEQADQDKNNLSKADNDEVKVITAFGFKTVSGAQARTITKFVAHAENETGMVGKDAVVSLLRSLLTGVAA